MSHTNPLPERLRASADEVQSFPHPSFCDHLHVAHDVMREAAAALEAYALGARSTAAQPVAQPSTMHDTTGTQALWPQMIAALAAIDAELGLPEDGCNSLTQTLAAIRKLKAAPPATSGDSTPPSATVQGDPSGALRPEPEAVGQDRVRAWTEAPGAERVWTCKVGGPVAGIPNGGDSPMRAAVSQAFEQVTGFEARFIFSGWGGELTEGGAQAVTWRSGNGWVEPDWLEASGSWFGDDYCYASTPTFWMPLPEKWESGS